MAPKYFASQKDLHLSSMSSKILLLISNQITHSINKTAHFHITFSKLFIAKPNEYNQYFGNGHKKKAYCNINNLFQREPNKRLHLPKQP